MLSSNEIKVFDRCVVLNCQLYNYILRNRITKIDVIESEEGMAFVKGSTLVIQPLIRHGVKFGIIYSRQLCKYLKNRYKMLPPTFSLKCIFTNSIVYIYKTKDEFFVWQIKEEGKNRKETYKQLTIFDYLDIKA